MADPGFYMNLYALKSTTYHATADSADQERMPDCIATIRVVIVNGYPTIFMMWLPEKEGQ